MKNDAGKASLMMMVETIQENKAHLGDIDGKIGDGDHGANMNKGFTMFGERIAGEETVRFTDGLEQLGMVLLNEIGGSMGPIYGTVFMEMAEAAADAEEIDLAQFATMLDAGLEGLYGIVEARVGDKTLVDTLVPVIESLHQSLQDKTEFSVAMEKAKQAAVVGRDSTIALEAKYGRSSRLGKRSIGVLDAGATSCCLLLCAMCDGLAKG